MDEFEVMALAAAAKKKRDAAPQPQTNIVEQAGTGTSEGLAGMLGLPVDMLTGAINMGVGGINKVAGTEIPAIQNPVGGSESLTGMLSPFMSEAQPQTGAQRFARRLGQEVGASAVPLGGAMMNAAKPAALMALDGISSLGSTLGGHIASELGANPTIEMIASMLGGAAPIGAKFAGRKGPQAPSMDELATQQSDAYKNAYSGDPKLQPQARDRIVDALQSRIAKEGNPEYLENVVRRTDGKIAALSPSPSLEELEQMRRTIGNDVAGHADSSTSTLGVELKKSVDKAQRALRPQDIIGPDPEAAISNLEKGRELTTRIKKAELLDAEDVGILSKKRRSANMSGTGGNEINSVRQGIGNVLGDPKKNRSFNDVEKSLMREIADGTNVDNGLRKVGRALSPTTGALQGAMGGALGLQAASSGNPAYLIPPAVGYAATTAGEALLNSKLRKLSEMIRNGKPVDLKTLTDTERRALITSMLSQGGATNAQQAYAQ